LRPGTKSSPRWCRADHQVSISSFERIQDSERVARRWDSLTRSNSSGVSSPFINLQTLCFKIFGSTSWLAGARWLIDANNNSHGHDSKCCCCPTWWNSTGRWHF
jgi:hypothetical protein